MIAGLILRQAQNGLDRWHECWQDLCFMNIPRFVGFAVFISVSLLRAQQQDASPPNAAAILQELETMEKKQKQGKVSERNAIIAQIQNASMNGPAAVSFYTQAVEDVEFKGRKDKVEAFIAWKKSHADQLRSKEMQTALLLHLKYLLLALQRKDLEKPETQLPAVTAYLNELISCDDLFSDLKQESRSLMDKPLGQSVFAQWLSLKQWLPDDKIWESRPGDVSGILEKNIRSIMREKKDAQLSGTWDLEMKVEAARVTAGRSDHKADQFNTVTLPQMQFKQAQDMILIGQPNRGLTQILTLARTNPWHPDFAIWVAKIREMVKPASAQTSPQPTPDSAPQ